MGIPHLITHLRPYAVVADLTTKNAPNVVIDGPAFAYHIYHLCLAAKADNKNPFEATPSYALLGNTAIQWLDTLRARDVKIKRLFFDGFLPVSKRSVRGERLRKYTQQLSSYHEAWPQNIPQRRAPSAAVQPPVELFSAGHFNSAIAQLPAAPFLVPAILEALSASPEYAEVFEVVAGEADLYCARYIREHGGCVITSDSDLLVHDLGPDGSVTFFRDISQTSTKGFGSISTIQYKLNDIATRLELPPQHGIRALAYEMHLDKHATLPQLLQRAQKEESIKSSKNLYNEFCAEYKPLPLLETVRVTADIQPAPEGLSELLSKLDPRTSEYVLQFPQLAKVADVRFDKSVMHPGQRAGVEVFMPFLIDCPTRTSGWEMSTAYRQLAYGLLNCVVPEIERITTVLEIRRQTTGGGGREWALPTIDQIEEACADIVEILKGIKSLCQTASNVVLWDALALRQELTWSNEEGRKSLATTVIEHNNQFDSTRPTWDIVHLAAQLHGHHYSFRMMRQIMEILVMYRSSIGLPGSVLELHQELQRMPPLGGLSSPQEFLLWLCDNRSIEALELARRSMGSSAAEETVAPSKSRKERKEKKRKRDKDLVGSETPRKQPPNIFDLLGDA